MAFGDFSGIRINQLLLSGATGSEKTYGASFLTENGLRRPLAVIGGGTQTGKTSIADFIRYCLGGSEHPQHPEVLAAVRAAIVECDLNGTVSTIERAATGTSSTFASLWEAPISRISEVSESRLSCEPPSNPLGLSQRILSACGLNGIELPIAPSQTESETHALSIRDLFRVMWLPNERLDSKNLLFEHSNYIVRQKFLQTIEVMFGVLDTRGADLASRLRAANSAAREASDYASSLKSIVNQDYPEGALALENELGESEAEVTELRNRLNGLDSEQNIADQAVTSLRRDLDVARRAAAGASVRVRNRQSLLDRLDSLRVQYADDKKKLTFLREAERLFDPLHVLVCPACLADLPESPSVVDSHCSMCGQDVSPTEAPLESTNDPQIDVRASEASAAVEPASSAVKTIEAELRATSRRLDELNEYWGRLDVDLILLRSAQSAADVNVNRLTAALNRTSQLPAPYLAARDELNSQIAEAQLRQQRAAAGLRFWDRVRDAEDVAERHEGIAERLRKERRSAKVSYSRDAMVAKLSTRFGEILADFKYPKLSTPMLDSRLMPSVRGLPYAAASSGGLVLISLAWYLSLWEVAYEEGAYAPNVLMLDSPQKNLGHGAKADDPEFADGLLVENFYSHCKTWLSGEGSGAQLIVIDNSPPRSVADDVVIRFTRDPNRFPYGLIDDATD